MKLTAVINKEGHLYTAWCPELDIASQGDNIEKAIENLKEAIELYLEDEDAKLRGSSPIVTTIEVKNAKTSSVVGL